MDTIVAAIAFAYFRSRTTQCGGGGRTSRSQVVKAEKLWEWYRDANYGDRPVVVTVDQGGHLWRNVRISCIMGQFILHMLDSFDFEIPVVSASHYLGTTALTSILYFTLMGKAPTQMVLEIVEPRPEEGRVRTLVGRSTGSMLVCRRRQTLRHTNWSTIPMPWTANSLLLCWTSLIGSGLITWPFSKKRRRGR